MYKSHKSTKVIAITSGKGGVGKSSIATSLSILLAKRRKKVLLLDADFGLPNLDIMLGLHGQHHLTHLLRGKCHLNDTILQGPGGINIILGSEGGLEAMKLGTLEYAGIIDSFNELQGQWDYLIIDTAAGVSEEVVCFTSCAQEVVIVVCNEPTSFTGAYALMKIMVNSYQWNRFHILVNMVHDDSEGLEVFHKLYAITDKLLDVRLDYLGAVPFDEEMHRAIKKQQSIVTAYPYANATRALRKVANIIDTWPLPDSLSLSGNSIFFIERIICN